MSKTILKGIPLNKYFDSTDLINKCIKKIENRNLPHRDV